MNDGQIDGRQCHGNVMAVADFIAPGGEEVTTKRLTGKSPVNRDKFVSRARGGSMPESTFRKPSFIAEKQRPAVFA